MCMLSITVSAFAAPPPDTQTQSPTTPQATSAATLPQVTVQAQREAIEKQAHTFVKKLSGSAWAPDDGEHPLGLWRRPVCPLVAGLARPQGEFVFGRLTDVMTAAGARPGARGCRPNLIVLVTLQPEELLKAWYKRDRRMFAGAMPAVVKRFFEKPLPVRLWYGTTLAGEDGDVANVGGTAATSGDTGGANGSLSLLSEIPQFQGIEGDRLGSRLGRGAVHDLGLAIVVVDLKQMEGMGWGQLADYIAMAALTNVDSYSNFADMPSILALFSTAPEARPKGLTDWDSAYLKALYHTDRMSPQQRLLIAQQMARQMDPQK
jgi:hypothetical protein